jgi:hypothetical protein
MSAKPEIIVNVIRVQTLDGPWEWADGDFEKVLPDGSTAPATYADYCKSLGLPTGPNRKIVDKRMSLKRQKK